MNSELNHWSPCVLCEEKYIKKNDDLTIPALYQTWVQILRAAGARLQGAPRLLHDPGHVRVGGQLAGGQPVICWRWVCTLGFPENNQ